LSSDTVLGGLHMTVTETLVEIALAGTLPALRAEKLEEIAVDKLEDDGDDDWAHYVNEEVCSLWGRLDLGQKLIAYIAASERVTIGNDRW
jgi:hypothetical protein